MSNIYQLVTPGVSPVDLNDMKSYLKLSSAADDDLINSMLSAATIWGENYTRREFRANSWLLLMDFFQERILIRRAPVDFIGSIQHLVSGSLVTINPSIYYLKFNHQNSEILLTENSDWPKDTDNREQAIEVSFTTKAYNGIDSIKTAITRHVAFWYSNRGDCFAGGSGGCDCDHAAKGSGVTSIYDQFRIDRV